MCGCTAAAMPAGRGRRGRAHQRLRFECQVGGTVDARGRRPGNCCSSREQQPGPQAAGAPAKAAPARLMQTGNAEGCWSWAGSCRWLAARTGEGGRGTSGGRRRLAARLLLGERSAAAGEAIGARRWYGQCDSKQAARARGRGGQRTPKLGPQRLVNDRCPNPQRGAPRAIHASPIAPASIDNTVGGRREAGRRRGRWVKLHGRCSSSPAACGRASRLWMAFAGDPEPLEIGAGADRREGGLVGEGGAANGGSARGSRGGAPVTHADGSQARISGRVGLRAGHARGCLRDAKPRRADRADRCRARLSSGGPLKRVLPQPPSSLQASTRSPAACKSVRGRRSRLLHACLGASLRQVGTQQMTTLAMTAATAAADRPACPNSRAGTRRTAICKRPRPPGSA